MAPDSTAVRKRPKNAYFWASLHAPHAADFQGVRPPGCAAIATTMNNTEPDRQTFNRLIAESQRLEGELKALLPTIAATRRAYMCSRAPEDRAEMERVQKLAEDLS